MFRVRLRHCMTGIEPNGVRGARMSGAVAATRRRWRLHSARWARGPPAHTPAITRLPIQRSRYNHEN